MLCHGTPEPEASGRLLKWVIGLGQFYVNDRPRTPIKGKFLADFIVKFTYSNKTEVARTIGNAKATKGVETEKGEMFAAENKGKSDDAE